MFYQWLLWGAFRRKYKAGPMQEKSPGSWTVLLFWAIRWKTETSFGSLGFRFRVYHEGMPLHPSVLLSDRPPPGCRPCLDLKANMLPIWAPNRAMTPMEKWRGWYSVLFLWQEQGTFHSEFHKPTRSTVVRKGPGEVRALPFAVEGGGDLRVTDLARFSYQKALLCVDDRIHL